MFGWELLQALVPFLCLGGVAVLIYAVVVNSTEFMVAAAGGGGAVGGAVAALAKTKILDKFRRAHVPVSPLSHDSDTATNGTPSTTGELRVAPLRPDVSDLEPAR